MADPTDNCNCCEGTTALTPVSVKNLPGQAALVYRVGMQGRFKETMKAAIAHRSALSNLTTRDDDDPSIALIDAWATTLDVLTFYQERIVNEGFLRTATERRSILELARSIGYELRPGVAASTYLAFELETAKGSPEKVMLSVGSRAQTIPGQDELPQTFETIEALEARPEWNRFKAKSTIKLLPENGAKVVYVEGLTTQLKPGDGLLFVLDQNNWKFRNITKITPLNELKITKIDWGDELDWDKTTSVVYAFRQRAALFGHNAPDWRTLPNSIKLNYLTPGGLSAEYFNNKDLTDSKEKKIDTGIDFDSANGFPYSSIDSDTFSVRWSGLVKADTSGEYIFYVESDDGVRLWVDGNLIIDQWIDQSFFDNNGKITLSAGQAYQIILEYHGKKDSAKITLSWSPPGKTKALIPANRLYPLPPDEWPNLTISGISSTTDPIIYLDNIYPSIVPSDRVVLSSPEHTEMYQVTSVREDSRQNFSLASKTTRLTLGGENIAEFNNSVRETVVYIAQEELTLAEAPDTSNIEAQTASIVIEKPVTGLSRGRVLIVSGIESKTGRPAAEKVILDKVNETNGAAELVFQNPLTQTYVRESVVIFANVAAATHGETKTEVLGSGDASRPFQKFLLKQVPLTYTATDQTPSGALSTLALRVNEVLWQETPSLYGLDRRSRNFITRLNDDGKVSVEFGDGRSGARLPSGVENVTAAYRVGTGLAGMVKAEQISLLMTRPLGVKGVSNPIAPEGGQDPETRDQARKNAPLTVLTLDRVVSLQDFEDFARAFGGVGKAQAVWLWDDQRAIVHLTIATAKGEPVPEASDLRNRLRNAIVGVSDPTQHFMIDTFIPLKFTVQVKVKFDPNYLMDKVTAAIKKLIAEEFGFERRAFGQPVTKSEVIALIQGVEGVIYVDLESFNNEKNDDGEPKLSSSLAAQAAHWKKDINGKNLELIKAELMTLDDLPNSVEVIPL